MLPREFLNSRLSEIVSDAISGVKEQELLQIGNLAIVAQDRRSYTHSEAWRHNYNYRCRECRDVSVKTIPNVPMAMALFRTYIFGGVGVPYVRTQAYKVRELGGRGGSMAPQDPLDPPLGSYLIKLHAHFSLSF